MWSGFMFSHATEGASCENQTSHWKKLHESKQKIALKSNNWSGEQGVSFIVVYVCLHDDNVNERDVNLLMMTSRTF